MTNKTKKYLLYSIPLIVGGYFIIKQFVNKGGGSQPDVPPPPPDPVSPNPPVSSGYPLQLGSKNSRVGALQSLLNTALKCQNKPLLVVDDNFGSKTEAALSSLTNMTIVRNGSEFDSIKKSLASTCQLSANLDWAWKMIDAANSGKYSNLVVNTPITMTKYIKDFTGKWVPKKPIETLTLGKATQLYNLNDYKLRAATASGNLRIEITRGANAGFYVTSNGIDLTTTFNIS